MADLTEYEEGEEVMARVVATGKIAKLNETKFHFSVALHHLREMQPEIVPTEALETWKKLLLYAELMDHAFNPPVLQACLTFIADVATKSTECIHCGKTRDEHIEGTL